MQISTTMAIDRKIPNTLLSLSSVLIFDLAVFTGDCIRLHRDNHALNRYFIDFRKDRPIEAVRTSFCLRQTRPFFVANEYLFVANKTFFVANQHLFAAKQNLLRRKRIFVCGKQNLLRRKPTFVCGKTKLFSSQ